MSALFRLFSYFIHLLKHSTVFKNATCAYVLVCLFDGKNGMDLECYFNINILIIWDQRLASLDNNNSNTDNNNNNNNNNYYYYYYYYYYYNYNNSCYN